MTANLDRGDPKRVVYETPESIDTLISKELLQISVRDRNAITEEIHGVSTLAPDESPESIEAALLELSDELDGIPDTSPIKASYLKSQKFPETYVNSNDFRLRFLRCELFDAKKAAIRMVSFLDFASELFGSAVLRRPMSITDFTKEELKNARDGYLQILPFRDRGGRPIVAWVGDFNFQIGTPQTRHKLSLYMAYSMTDDIESQRKGCTMLVWTMKLKMSDAGLPAWEDAKYQKKFSEAIPIRRCSTHFCLPDKPFFHILRSTYALTNVYGSERSRLKFHVGEETEVRYKLKTFGIPIDLIPITGTGNIKTTQWKQWMRAREELEVVRMMGDSDVSITECPRSTDVLFRMGSSLACHPGNSMLQSLIESKINEHSAATQNEKIDITKGIIDAVTRKQGRFLKWDSRGFWTELEDTLLIHRKVAVSIKGFRGKLTAKRNLQTPRSSTYIFQNLDGKRRKISLDDDNSTSWENCCFVSIPKGDKAINQTPDLIRSIDFPPKVPSELFTIRSDLLPISNR